MRIYERTKLWQSTLARRPDHDPDEAIRDRFRQSFVRFRERGEQLAGEISQGIRELTVHDVSHIDALWCVADLIVGNDYELSPAEAYVLGGAFLLHDLGLALASYPNGIDDLKRLPLWRDSAAQLLRQKNGRAPTKDDIEGLDAGTSQSVLESVLRFNHAHAAHTLAVNEYRHGPASTAYYLIEDTELRNAYAELIGRIAYSHWWPIEQLAGEFNGVIGAFTGASPDWVIDPLKIACILRAADACHIDAKRAPGFLRALRKPSGTADKHWRFQEYVQTPSVDKERVVFSVARPIPIDDADAWWVGYELIQVADRELRDVDMLLRDCNRQPFLANGVAGANDPLRLKRFIRTVGWEPVSTEIGVSNVASLVRKLGGAALYGNNPKVPLRELLQNARDAIAARRAAEPHDAAWGQITVRLVENGDQECLEVHDNGIGMSQRLLCGPFLDFGTSYWHTPLMIEEHAGLAASGFEPQGRFGIGFFSVFMWGKRVSVVTRSIHEGPRSTRVMEFNSGLSTRPLLRPARDDEHLAEPGTIVRVWLKTKARDRKGLLTPQTYPGMSANLTEERDWTLSELCAWLCPAIDVSIITDEKGKVDNAISANDWQTIGSSQLMYRLVLHSCKDNSICEELQFKQISANVRPIVTANGEWLGRAALTLDMKFSNPRENAPFPICHTTTGAFRGWSWNWGYIVGLLIGQPTRASRDWSDRIALKTLDALGIWATDQAQMLDIKALDLNRLSQYALAVRGFGGNTGDLPIGRDSSGLVSFRSLAARRDLPNEVELYDDQWQLGHPTEIVLAPHQIAVSTGSMRILDIPQHVPDPLKRADHPTWTTFWMSLWAAAIEAISMAWDVPLKEVLDISEVKGGWKMEKDKSLRLVPDIIRNPRAIR